MNRFLKPITSEDLRADFRPDPTPLNQEEHEYQLRFCMRLFFKHRHNKCPLIGNTTISEFNIEDAAYHLTSIQLMKTSELSKDIDRIRKFFLDKLLDISSDKYIDYILKGIKRAKNEKETRNN